MTEKKKYTLKKEITDELKFGLDYGKIVFTRIFVPQCLDLSLFDEFNATYRKTLFRTISTLFQRHSTKVHDTKFNKDSFIPMARRSLTKISGLRNVKRNRDDLISLGIIEVCDLEKGDFGNYLLGYRFTPAYRDEPVINIMPKKERENLLDESKKQIDIIMSKKQFDPNEEYLRGCLKNVTIDEEAALTYLDYLYNQEKSIATHARNCTYVNIQVISDGKFYFSQSSKTGRVFTPVCNLKSDFRQFLKYEGRELVDIDISNCQPLLLYVLYKDKTTNEAIAFKELVSSGQFNERISELCGIVLENPEDRKKFKVALLTQLFMENYKRGKYLDLFFAAFPELAIEIKKVKAKDYRNIAILLQNLEADLIIQGVIGICREKNIPALTIHDSILTLPEYKDEVSFIIIDECQKMYDVKPNLK